MLQARNKTAIICRRKPNVSVGRLLSILRMRIIAQNTKVSRSNKTAIIYPRKPKVSMGQLLSILQIRIIAQDTKVSRSNKIPTIPFGTKRSEQASVPNSCSKNAEQFRNTFRTRFIRNRSERCLFRAQNSWSVFRRNIVERSAVQPMQLLLKKM